MTDRTILGVHGRRVWDSRGRPTVEVEVTLGEQAVGRMLQYARPKRQGGDFPGGLVDGHAEPADLAQQVPALQPLLLDVQSGT